MVVVVVCERPVGMLCWRAGGPQGERVAAPFQQVASCHSADQAWMLQGWQAGCAALALPPATRRLSAPTDCAPAGAACNPCCSSTTPAPWKLRGRGGRRRSGRGWRPGRAAAAAAAAGLWWWRMPAWWCSRRRQTIIHRRRWQRWAAAAAEGSRGGTGAAAPWRGGPSCSLCWGDWSCQLAAYWVRLVGSSAAPSLLLACLPSACLVARSMR